MGLRLDEEKLEMLQSWGEGLSHDPRDEVRAAGKAIIMLVEEIELLHVDLWHARSPAPAGSDAEPVSHEPDLTDVPVGQEPDATPARSLRTSIARLRDRHSPTAPA